MHRLSMMTIGHTYKLLKRKNLTDEEITKKVMKWVMLNEKIICPLLNGISCIIPGGDYLDALGVPFIVKRYKEDIFPLTTLEFEGYL